MIPGMRGAARAWALASTGLLLGACVQEATAPAHAPARAEAAPVQDAAAPSEPPPQYVVGDPARPSSLTLVPLADEGTGIILEGVRFVLRGALARTSRDVGDAQLQAAWRVPASLGGGYLFRARAILYASESFEGLLRPVVTLPAEVSSLSFGPKSVLVRADSGERWMIELSTGKRVPIDPPGLLQIAALDDRAAALVEGGQLLVSTDRGGHWKDATPSLRQPPKRVFVARSAPGREDAIWIETQSGGAYGVVAGGRVAEFDALPVADVPPTLRPKQDAWREDEPPVRRAMRAGIPTRDGTALVAASGDLVQVDVASGAIEVVAAGKLPPDASCTGARTQDDSVLLCARPNSSAFVVSHVLDRPPVVEQPLVEGGHFVVSDDGGILWTGPCDKPSPQARRMACVRSPAGTWQTIDLDPAEAGASTPYDVARWIPRGDGGAIAVVSNIGGIANAWGLVDARTGELHAWPADAVTPQVRGALVAFENARGFELARAADRVWMVTPQGTLRGWAALSGGTGAIEVGLDGSLQTSPFTFERVASAGPIALARTREGRVWQTLDRGTTWSEVAAPPAMRPGGYLDPHACSLIGCDLGPWYRIGWAPTAPFTQPAPTTAPPAPHIDRVSTPALACHATGDSKRAQAVRDEHSPDDLGLGATRLPVADPKGLTEFLRLSFSRRIVGSIREADANDDGAPRALIHGPATAPGDDRLVVQGFDKNILALSRQVAFVPAFDPAGVVRRAPIAMRDLVVAARSAGLAQADVLRDDPIPTGVVPVTPADPTAADDLLVQVASGASALLRASPAAKARYVYESGRADDMRIVSAVALDGDAFGYLEEDGSGHARALRFGSTGGPTVVLDIDAPPTSDLYPANLDALAVGPRGELAVLRTPSGGEPASAADPAVLLMPGAPAQILAPWSTLVTADDPACKNDPGGWRVTLQTMAAWIRLTGAADLRAADDGRMFARVRWSPTRVCLEAVELRTQDLFVPGGNTPSQFGTAWDAPVESWAVARFVGGGAAGRVVMLPGAEVRQPLECKLAP
jgi:hypothetical protein